jgi:Flp pilus assembly protein TadG
MDTTGLKMLRNRRGIALVYVALCLFALIGFLALVIDLGHMYVVRGELQNAADATALAGAASLYKDPLNPTADPALDFTRAQTAATNFVGQNKSDRVTLTNGEIQTGYWDLSSNSMLPTTITPTSQQVPAVSVTIRRTAGSNGGAVPTFFANIFGITQVPVPSRMAVAVSGYPGAVPAGAVFPIALSSCMTEQYFSQNPLPNPPTQISTNTPYLPGGSTCETAQWTSLTANTNSENVIAGYMDDPSTVPSLQTGDDIWIATGAMASLYGNNKCGDYVGQDVLMPIVSGTTGTISKTGVNGTMEITGFAIFHVDSCEQSTKHVTGHFVGQTKNYPGTRPGGSVSNTVTPPLMVH